MRCVTAKTHFHNGTVQISELVVSISIYHVSLMLLMFIIILLKSHILFLMSYRLVHNIILKNVVLFILKTSMASPGECFC